MSRNLHAATVVSVAVSLTACSSTGHQPDTAMAPTFALTEARVIHHDDQLPVNLVFIASEDDPLWTQLSGVELNGGLDVTGYELVAGDVTEWGRLGNLTLTAQLPTDPVTATDVTVFLEGGTSATFPIGAWRVRASGEPGGQILQVADYIVAYPDADLMEFTATNVSDDHIEVTAPDLGLETLTVTDVMVNGQVLQADGGVDVPPDAEVTFTLSLASSGEHDFFMTSPTVAVTGPDGEEMKEIFDPSMLGFSDITEEEIAAFAGSS